MGLLPVLQPQVVHFHDYRSPTADFMRSAACTAQRMYARAGVTRGWRVECCPVPKTAPKTADLGDFGMLRS